MYYRSLSFTNCTRYFQRYKIVIESNWINGRISPGSHYDTLSKCHFYPFKIRTARSDVQAGGKDANFRGVERFVVIGESVFQCAFCRNICLICVIMLINREYIKQQDVFKLPVFPCHLEHEKASLRCLLRLSTVETGTQHAGPWSPPC